MNSFRNRTPSPTGLPRDFNTVFAGLKESITDETTYVFMMYALNESGRQPYYDTASGDGRKPV